MAANPRAGIGLPGGRAGTAGRPGVFAAIGKPTGRQIGCERRHGARDGGEWAPALGRTGQRGKQFARVGVARRGEQRLALGKLHDMPGIHHRHTIGHLVDHGQIVGDQQQRHAAFALQAAEQRQNLSLNGHIERGRGFVGDEHIRLAGECDGDHHALLEPARELVRIGIPACRRVRHADFLEQGQAAFASRPAAQAGMGGQRLANLLADGEHRVERAHRFLKHHADTRAAAFAHGRFRQAQQILAAQAYRTVQQAGVGLGRQPHQR